MLAQKALQGQTKGYRNHLQLQRFLATSDPRSFIARYLETVYEEACQRSYSFDASKLVHVQLPGTIAVTRGQLAFERAHVQMKLQARNPEWLEHHPVGTAAHPLFHIVSGDVEAWEKSQAG